MPLNHILPILPQQDMLAFNSSEAMAVVSDFIGLVPIDWSRYNIVANAHSTTHFHETVDELPIEPAVLSRLQAFFATQPNKYYSMVRHSGYHGCHPDHEHVAI